MFGSIPNVLAGPQLNGNTAMMNTGISNSANLFIFSPRMHNQQFKRTYMYNFNADFCMDAMNVLGTTAKYKNLDINHTSFMHGDNSANFAILPNAQGVPVNLNVFSAMWTFLLIIDIVRGTKIPTLDPMYAISHQSPSDSRYIYFGYCSDEPINPNTSFGTTPTINTKSLLFITHYSYIATNQMIDAHRSQTVVNTLADSDITPPESVRMMHTANGPAIEYYNKPDKLLNSISVNTGMAFEDGGNTYTVDGSGVSHIALFHKPISTPTSLNSPRHHIRDIVKTLSDGYAMTIDGVEEDKIPVNQYDRSYFINSVQDNLQSHHQSFADAVAPLVPTNYYTLDQILCLYPNLKVNDCRIPATSQWDVVSQESPTIVNIYSSLISSALPPLLSAQAISQIAFRYSSIDRSNSFALLEKQDSMELMDIATFVPIPPESVQVKFQTLMRYLKQTLFPIILAAGGDFDLMVFTSVSGTNIVSLNFYDYPTLSSPSAFYESYNSLGGIMSPIIGTANEFNHNALNIANLVASVAP